MIFVKSHLRFWLQLLFMCTFPLTIYSGPAFRDSIARIKSHSRPEKLIKELNVAAFTYCKAYRNSINIGLTGDRFYYILLKVKVLKEHQNLILTIDNTSLDSIYVYSLRTKGKGKLLYLGGALVSFDNSRKYVWHTVPVGEGGWLYYLVALKASQKNINIHYEILPEDKLSEKYQQQDRIIFFYMGVVVLIVTVMTITFLLFKKVVFAAYMGYILCAFIWIISHYGYLFPYFYPRIPILNEVVKPISSLGAAFFLLQVIQRVFSSQLRLRTSINKVVNVTVRFLPIVMVSMFFLTLPGLTATIKFLMIVLWHIALVFTFCLIAFVPIIFYMTGATAKIFSAAMLIVCMMTALQLLSNAGIFKNHFFAEHGISLGSLLENIIIAFGVFNNLLKERKQREEQVLTLEAAQAETLKRLILMQDNERKRIAGDLHDNIGPLLAALKINFNRIINHKEEENGLIIKTEAIINDSILEIRNIAHNLMPKGITSKGLINALDDYFESMQTLYQKNIVFEHDVQSIFQTELQINVYRIICELVLNAAKHSNASAIKVTLSTDVKFISIHIFDNGQGFPPDRQRNSLGLQNAESRVNFLHGQLLIESKQGKGTAIHIDMPL